MMKALMMTLIAGTLLIPAAEAGPKNRQIRQGQRIGQGVRSGQLTPSETRGLSRALDRNRRTIRRDRVDGGGLTGRERVKNHARQDRLSRQIYRQKHDSDTRR